MSVCVLAADHCPAGVRSSISSAGSVIGVGGATSGPLSSAGSTAAPGGAFGSKGGGAAAAAAAGDAGEGGAGVGNPSNPDLVGSTPFHLLCQHAVELQNGSKDRARLSQVRA